MEESCTELLKQVSELCLREPDESKPYEFKYAAAELCKDGVEKASGKVLADILASPPEDADQQLYVMLARRGLVLMETDLLADAQSCVEVALKHLEADEEQHLALLLECHNALGALQSGRDDLDNAMASLEKSYALYMRHRQQGHDKAVGSSTHAASAGPPHADAAHVEESQHGGASPEHALEVSAASPGTSGTDAAATATAADGSCAAATGGGHAAASTRSREWDEVERQHTSTLFFLAQVHGHAKRKALSAKFCAATLQRQLESGQFQVHEWLQNCMQLSGYYVSSNAFAVAQYCLLAADQVSDRAAKGELLPTRPKAAAEQQQGAGQPAAGSALQQQDAEAGSVQQQQQEGEELARTVLEPDVVANLRLAWAKLHLGRLVASHEHFIDELEPTAPYPEAEQYKDLIMFDCLDLPPLSSLPWGTEVLVSTFEQARDVFNAAMVHFKAALEYYVLDGWVTEHCNIQMEISNMYRCLASFEPDVRRKRLMHQQRAQRLQPLHGHLNPEFFLGLVRSIALELGNVSRDVMELEDKEGRPTAKVAATRKEAIRYYQDFMDTFREPMGPQGVLPDRITDEANERFFLLASLSLGRVMCGRVTDRETEPMAKACDLLRWTADYIKRHQVTQFEREAKMSLEMVELMTEKMELSKRLASSPR